MKKLLAGKSFIGFPFLIFLTIINTIYSRDALAQFNEFGMGAGGFNYRGDLVRDFDFSNFTPGFVALYRRNISGYLSVRMAVTAGRIKGSDDKPFDALSSERMESFNASLFELSGTFEYYFLDFRSERTRVNWSPYLFGGISLFTFSPPDEKRGDYSSVQPALPLGIGFRYNFSQKISMSFEFGARKTFTDWLDNVSGATTNIKDYKYGNPHQNDWYYFAGLSMAYTIYTIPCPFK